MDRTEKAGLGVALTGHIVLFGLLSVGFLATPNPLKIERNPVEVTFADDVGLEATTPRPAEQAPATSVAPELGEPEPAPLPPQAQAQPEPRPAPPEPAPSPIPAPKPRSAKPSARQQQAAAKTAPARPSPPAKARPRGARLGDDFLKGISETASVSRTATASTAVIGQKQVMQLAALILAQVQPCANRIPSPGPGAEKVVTQVNLRLNRDGTLQRAPTVVKQTVPEDVSKYAPRVAEMARVAFAQCAPYRLPGDLYQGWKDFDLRYRLPD